MPPFKDLTGQKIGQLVILRLAEKGSRYHWWLCTCDCGTTEIVHAIHFSRHSACTACRKPPCTICDGKIPLERGQKNTCSTLCASIKLKNIGNRSYANRIAQNPAINQARHDAVRRRRQQDPEFNAACQQKERERYALRKHDPAYQKYKHQYHQEYWQANKDAITAARRLRLHSLNLEAREALRADALKRTTAYRRAWLIELKKDPIAYEQYRTDQKTKRIEWQRKRALMQLSQDLTKLGN